MLRRTLEHLLNYRLLVCDLHSYLYYLEILGEESTRQDTTLQLLVSTFKVFTRNETALIV